MPIRIASGFESCGPLALGMPPRTRLLSVRSELRLQLPSHDTSPRRSCCSARGSPDQRPQRTSTSKSRAMPGTPQKRAAWPRWRCAMPLTASSPNSLTCRQAGQAEKLQGRLRLQKPPSVAQRVRRRFDPGLGRQRLGRRNADSRQTSSNRFARLRHSGHDASRSSVGGSGSLSAWPPSRTPDT